MNSYSLQVFGLQHASSLAVDGSVVGKQLNSNAARPTSINSTLIARHAHIVWVAAWLRAA